MLRMRSVPDVQLSVDPSSMSEAVIAATPFESRNASRGVGIHTTSGAVPSSTTTVKLHVSLGLSGLPSSAMSRTV